MNAGYYITQAFSDFWNALADSLPACILSCLIMLSVLTLAYACIRWVMSLFKSTKFKRLTDILFLVVSICGILIQTVPHLQLPARIIQLEGERLVYVSSPVTSAAEAAAEDPQPEESITTEVSHE